jgi:hypothetical protein
VRVCDRAHWANPTEIKRQFGATVDFVGDDRVIFDLGCNKYRRYYTSRSIPAGNGISQGLGVSRDPFRDPPLLSRTCSNIGACSWVTEQKAR